MVEFSYPKCMRFACNDCGICCGDTPTKTRRILLLRSDAERIAAQTGKQIADFTQTLDGKSPYVYELRKNSANGKCLFHQNNRCGIYEARPLVCRFYPFELSAAEDGTPVFTVTLECPAVSVADSTKGGEILGKAYFKRLLRLAHAELDASGGKS
ncbi:MAG: YkgJ family cysteine cluster protein [Candidatus Bathyarchaeia archaeon]